MHKVDPVTFSALFVPNRAPHLAFWVQTLHDDCSVVVSAPTGAGKTMILDLALVRLLHSSQYDPVLRSHGQRQGKQVAVYLAPTKALCEERSRDWSQRFSTLVRRTCGCREQQGPHKPTISLPLTHALACFSIAAGTGLPAGHGRHLFCRSQGNQQSGHYSDNTGEVGFYDAQLA